MKSIPNGKAQFPKLKIDQSNTNFKKKINKIIYSPNKTKNVILEVKNQLKENPINFIQISQTFKTFLKNKLSTTGKKSLNDVVQKLIEAFNDLENKDVIFSIIDKCVLEVVKEEINFDMQVFLILSSSSIANLAKKKLKKQKVMLNSLIVLSHHDRIIEVMKEECHDIKFYKIISLTPKIIADEVKKHLSKF